MSIRSSNGDGVGGIVSFTSAARFDDDDDDDDDDTTKMSLNFFLLVRYVQKFESDRLLDNK